MSPEQELVQQWLEKAHLDLRGAELVLTTDPPLTITEARAALRVAHGVYEFVLQRLPEQTHPER